MIRVTVEDLSGEQTTDSAVIEDDYIITCAGSCYVEHIATYPTTGTHVVTIKGRKPGSGKHPDAEFKVPSNQPPSRGAKRG